MRVKPHHPLMELLGQLLFGIENVPRKEQRLMVNRACREAVKWHQKRVEKMRDWVKDMESDTIKNDGLCPECNEWLGDYTGPYHPGVHRKDCELKIMWENNGG